MTNTRSDTVPHRRLRPCPECGGVSARVYYPFCSARCKDVDLNRWLSGAYAIPASGDVTDTGGTPESGT